MNWWQLAGAVLSGTALAAVLGKLLDIWWLEPMRARSEQRRWLRETRLEAFSKLSEEVLSFGLKNATFDDIWKFRTISARAELLVDDAKLLGDIRGFISDLYEMNAHGNSGDIISDYENRSGRLSISCVSGVRRGIPDCRLAGASTHLQSEHVPADFPEHFRAQAAAHGPTADS